MKLDIHFDLHRLIYEETISNDPYMTTLRLQFGNTVLDFVNKHSSIFTDESYFIREFVYSRLKKRSKSVIIGELLELLSKENSISSQMENFFGWFEWVGIYPLNLLPSYLNMYQLSFPDPAINFLKEGIITKLYTDSIELRASDWRLLMWSLYEKIIKPLYPIMDANSISSVQRVNYLSYGDERYERRVYISTHSERYPGDVLLKGVKSVFDVENIFEGLINKGKITPFHYLK